MTTSDPTLARVLAAALRAVLSAVEQAKKGGCPLEPFGPTCREARDALAAYDAAQGQGAADPLHPNGRCECGGEGRCLWCVRIEHGDFADRLGRVEAALRAWLGVTPIPDGVPVNVHLRALLAGTENGR